MAQTSSYNPIVSKLFRSRNTLLEILSEKRGFNVSDYTGFSVTELHSMMKNEQLDMLLENNETGKKIFVKYHLGPKLKSNGAQIYDYIDDLYDIEQILKDDDELIIVTKDKTNDGIKAIITQVFINDNKFINIYNLHSYLFNILRHDMVPDHTVLSEEDKNAVKKKYYITHESQFPEISRFDPVAQAIGLRPGQLVEIIRASPTAITTKYYRLCY
jgi:DNA-directed RNA polymerase subunit H (RpoH/RPB5)|tara:strand:+ start:567 stop:1211 length:645 start_codon:yes stop_codon:yes gene_type:complete